MTDLERSFLESIAAQPQDDFPRLAYADWLEEHGQSERAEFIRVQCELAQQDFRCTCTCEYEHGIGCLAARGKKLRRREKELLFDHWPRWLHDVFDGLSHDVGVSARDDNDFGVSLYNHQQGEQGHLDCCFRRGFISRITLPCAAFLEHAGSIIEAVPMLEEVRLSDKTLGNSYINPKRWMWFHESVPLSPCPPLSEANNLPDGIFRCLKGGRGSVPLCKWYDSQEEGTADMSQACLTFAHDQLAARREIRTAEYLFGQVFTDSTTP